MGPRHAASRHSLRRHVAAIIEGRRVNDIGSEFHSGPFIALVRLHVPSESKRQWIYCSRLAIAI